MNRSLTGCLVFLVIGSIAAAVFLVAALHRPAPKPIPQALVTEKPRPPIKQPKPQPAPVIEEKPKETADPDLFEQLQTEIDAVVTGLAWSVRANGMPGRHIVAGRSSSGLVVTGPDPEAIERYARRTIGKNDDVYRLRQFVFYGEKSLIARIRAAVSRSKASGPPN